MQFLIILNILLLKNLINYKLTAEYFAARLKQAELGNKTEFDDKVATSNRQITSNRANHLEVQKKLNSLIKKKYSFFCCRS